jgi:hypothetical protein
MIKPAVPHSDVNMQSHNNGIAQLNDDDVPAADAISSPAPVARPGRAKAKAKTRPEPEDMSEMAHRSLYARPETLDLIRRIAFEERISAQALYREGLFLMLRKRGHYKDKSLDDV